MVQGNQCRQLTPRPLNLYDCNFLWNKWSRINLYTTHCCTFISRHAFSLINSAPNAAIQNGPQRSFFTFMAAGMVPVERLGTVRPAASWIALLLTKSSRHDHTLNCFHFNRTKRRIPGRFNCLCRHLVDVFYRRPTGLFHVSHKIHIDASRAMGRKYKTNS